MVDMIIENRNENEDFLSLTHFINSELEITYDLKSLMKSDIVNDIDPELNSHDITDIDFLMNQRKRAETKLIKSKIIYKTHHDLALSTPEKAYLKQWINVLTSSN